MTPFREKYRESDSAFLKNKTEGENKGKYQLK